MNKKELLYMREIPQNNLLLIFAKSTIWMKKPRKNCKNYWNSKWQEYFPKLMKMNTDQKKKKMKIKIRL